jgi:hypothetical protein
MNDQSKIRTHDISVEAIEGLRALERAVNVIGSFRPEFHISSLQNMGPLLPQQEITGSFSRHAMY